MAEFQGQDNLQNQSEPKYTNVFKGLYEKFLEERAKPVLNPTKTINFHGHKVTIVGNVKKDDVMRCQKEINCNEGGIKNTSIISQYENLKFLMYKKNALVFDDKEFKALKDYDINIAKNLYDKISFSSVMYLARTSSSCMPLNFALTDDEKNHLERVINIIENYEKKSDQLTSKDHLLVFYDFAMNEAFKQGVPNDFLNFTIKQKEALFELGGAKIAQLLGYVDVINPIITSNDLDIDAALPLLNSDCIKRLYAKILFKENIASNCKEKNDNLITLYTNGLFHIKNPMECFIKITQYFENNPKEIMSQEVKKILDTVYFHLCDKIGIIRHNLEKEILKPENKGKDVIIFCAPEGLVFYNAVLQSEKN